MAINFCPPMRLENHGGRKVLRNMRLPFAANEQPAKSGLPLPNNTCANGHPSCLSNVSGHHCNHKESFNLGYRGGCSRRSHRSKLVLLFQR